MPPENVYPMKQFRLPHGLRVWNGPACGWETGFIYREMFNRQSYLKHGVAVSHGDTVFDVGAHIGLFALSLMGRFRDLRIYCFEPVPSTYACLTRNLAESPWRAGHWISTFDVAVGAANGQITIESFPSSPCNSTMFTGEKRRETLALLDDLSPADVWRASKFRALINLPLYPFRKLLGPYIVGRAFANSVLIPCQVRTVSGMIRDHGVERVDLLKIDVEGAEMDALAGIEECHWPLVRQLAMEVSPVNKRHVTALLDRLRSLGFTRVATENMFGGPCNLDDAILCTVYALRG